MARPKVKTNAFAPQCRKIIEKAFRETELFIQAEEKNDRIGAKTMMSKYIAALRREADEFQKEFDKWDGQPMKTRGGKPKDPWFWDKMFWINQISVREDKVRGGILLGPKSMGKIAKVLSSALDEYEDGEISNAAIEVSQQRFKEMMKAQGMEIPELDPDSDLAKEIAEKMRLREINGDNETDEIQSEKGQDDE